MIIISLFTNVLLTFVYRNGVSPLSGKYNTQSFPDKSSDNEIAGIPMECEYKWHGCIWRHQIQDCDVSNILV